MSSLARILVVDDEPSITDFIALGLRHEGYEVATAADGRAGLRAVAEFKPDLAILDVMMPNLDGFELCRAISGEPRRGIIILSARDETTDRIHGLELGADDYLVKPFVEEELAARLRALLRRGRLPLHATLTAGDLVIDQGGRTVTYKGKPVTLAATEFRVLEYLAINLNLAVSREQILERVWGDAFDGQSNIVDVYMSAIRRKLAAAGVRKRIVTVWGIGYKLIE